MGKVTLNLIGASVHVPHTDGKALLTVLPNATHLGNSPETAPDGTRLSRHWPVLWEQKAGEDQWLTLPQPFLGARLEFVFDGSPCLLDLQGIASIATKSGGFQVDPAVLEHKHDDRVAAQILITSGRVEPLDEPEENRPVSWVPDFPQWSLNKAVAGLKVEIEGVEKVTAEANPYLEKVKRWNVYERDVAREQEVTLYLGNVCAEDVLDWARNSRNGSIDDRDFLWVYRLCEPSAIVALMTAGRLPVPRLRGTPVDAAANPAQAFQTVLGGGGLNGGECRSYLHPPLQF
jgi:hypothetical protein